MQHLKRRWWTRQGTSIAWEVVVAPSSVLGQLIKKLVCLEVVAVEGDGVDWDRMLQLDLGQNRLRILRKWWRRYNWIGLSDAVTWWERVTWQQDHQKHWIPGAIPLTDSARFKFRRRRRCQPYVLCSRIFANIPWMSNFNAFSRSLSY